MLINTTQEHHVQIAIHPVILALLHQPALALLAQLDIIKKLAIHVDLPALAQSTILILISKPANHAQTSADIALKQHTTATIAILVNITNLITGIATPLAQRTPDTTLLLLKEDVFHAEIRTAYLAIALVIAQPASHSGNSTQQLDDASKNALPAAQLARPTELALHASMAGLTTPPLKLALAQKLAAANVALLNVTVAKRAIGSAPPQETVKPAPQIAVFALQQPLAIFVNPGTTFRLLGIATVVQQAVATVPVV